MSEETKNSHEYLLRKAYLQMTLGCKRRLCLNPYCQKNPGFPYRTTEECRAYTLFLAEASDSCSLNNSPYFIFCSDQILSPESTHDLSSNRAVLIFFSNVENIGLNFLADRPSSTDPMINWQEYDCFVRQISEIVRLGALKDDFLVSIINEYRLTGYSRLYLPRCCLVLMCGVCSMNLSMSSMCRLCQLITGNVWMNEQLSNWLDTFSKLRIEQILYRLQENITHKFQNITTQDSLGDLIAMLRVATLVWESNCRKERLSYKLFYNGSINRAISLTEEYQKWKQLAENRKKMPLNKAFSFIEYPWIIDCSNKTKLLQLENYEYFEKELGQFLLISFLSGGFIYPYLQFEVRRDFMVEDTLAQLSLKEINLKKPLKIKFIGEEGIDEGGVKKEYFHMIVKKLFEASYEMFIYKESQHLYWFNPNCPLLHLYEMLGVLLGLAIYNGISLDLRFPLALYKKLQNVPTIFEDLKEFDLYTVQSLERLLELGDDPQSLCLSFLIELDSFGNKLQYELVEGGKDILVTDQNKTNFASLYVKWLLHTGVHSQFESFKRGFLRICGEGLVKLLRPEEIEAILCGCPLFDLRELESVAIYENGYTRESLTVSNR